MPRARKPRSLKLLEGNPGKEARAKLDPSREPQFKRAERGGLKPPSWLPQDAKVEWKRVAPELARLDLFQGVDRATLACYCASYAMMKQCQQFISANGTTYRVPNKTGVDFVNPYPQVAMLNKAMEQVRRFGQEFGFSPVARGRIEIPKIEKEDALWEALRKPRKIKRPSKLPQRSL